MLLPNKKFICKNSKGGNCTKPTQKKQKDYGIMQKIKCRATPNLHLFFAPFGTYSVSFWFFNPPLLWEAYKLFHYAKSSTYFSRQPVRHLSIYSAGSPSALAAFTFCLSALHPQVSVSPSASFWHQGLSASLWLFRLVLSIRCSWAFSIALLGLCYCFKTRNPTTRAGLLFNR